ncbi:MAG TPA: hypothetical protein DGK91_05940 [Clostridium sp.]|nr:hypothetical protein [Clostridium sp.]
MGKAKLRIIIMGLADTAREKICVMGDDKAMPEVLNLKQVAEDLAVFWGCEELEGLFADRVGVLFA